MKIEKLEDRAWEALSRRLQDVPFLSIEPEAVRQLAPEAGPDLSLSIRSIGWTGRLVVEVKSSGEPRYARQAVNQILRYTASPDYDYGILIAPYISPRAAAICRQAGVGYLDLAGNCHLSFEQVYIHQEGNPNPFASKRYPKSLYSPKAERILRVLLVRGPTNWKVEALAAEAGVSLGLVSNVKKLLADQEWIASERVGFALTDPMALLDEWSQHYSFRRNSAMDFYAMHSPADLENELAAACQSRRIPYGLTGLSAAARYAPAVRYNRVMAFVQGEMESLATSLGLKRVSSGVNVTLLRPYDEGVLFGSQSLADAMVVSPIQVYLDLMGYRGRGQEAAQALLEQVIRPTW